MDMGYNSGNKIKSAAPEEVGLVNNVEVHKGLEELDCEYGELKGRSEDGIKPKFGFFKVLRKIPQAWEVPVSLLLKLTNPQNSPSEWSRFYQSANISLCPLALLYSCKSFVPLDHPIIFLFPNSHFPLWLVVLCGSSSLAVLHYIVEKEPPKTEQVPLAVLHVKFWKGDEVFAHGGRPTFNDTTNSKEQIGFTDFLILHKLVKS